jgi:mono/diheme cytochrome c family protein
MLFRLLAGLAAGTFFTFFSLDTERITPETSVEDVLVELGARPMSHEADVTIPGVSAEIGEQIVLSGITSYIDGKKTSKQSKHFVCTSCHNVQREDPDLAQADPQARLEYGAEHGIPFLPGTTLYGAVNRSTFYNGDYEKKYGDLVKPARNDLREAIQLCAIECSQGRLLEEWELESVLEYLWTLELKIQDLQLTEAELGKVQRALQTRENRREARELLQSKFLPGSPATFVTPPENRKEGYAYEGDPGNGKMIYEQGCLHCHQNERYSFFNLDDTDYSFDHLANHIDRYTRYSIYQVIRWGTQPHPGKRAYMPNFTLEKMSHQQVEDLRAYIEQRAQ